MSYCLHIQSSKLEVLIRNTGGNKCSFLSLVIDFWRVIAAKTVCGIHTNMYIKITLITYRLWKIESQRHNFFFLIHIFKNNFQRYVTNLENKEKCDFGTQFATIYE